MEEDNNKIDNTEDTPTEDITDDLVESPIESTMGNASDEDLSFTDIPYDPRRKIDDATITRLVNFPLTPSSDPVNDYDVANKQYVDSEHGVYFPNTEVFDGNGPSSYTDLDLSAVVGANSAMVYLRVKHCANLYDIYYFRVNGETEGVSVDTTYATGGVSVCDPVGDGGIEYVIVVTDSAGIVEWLSNNQHATKINVIAYIK